ncbi:MAG: hypothetical protein ACXWZ8_00145 [Gaiellaceae bacterium]
MREVQRPRRAALRETLDAEITSLDAQPEPLIAAASPRLFRTDLAASII